MKNAIFSLLMGLCLCFWLPHAAATHIVGGTVGYTCLSYNSQTQMMNLRVRMYVYRDAINGQAPFDNPAALGVYIGQSGNNLFNTYSMNNPVISTVPLVLNNPCIAVPPNVAVEEAIYTIDISLPYNANGYTLAYQRCCRNNSISNLVNPGNVGATYPIYLSPLAMTSCNSSPVFNEFPPIAICRGEALSFDHSATDRDGNRIEYSFCFSRDGATPTDPAPTTPSSPPYANVPFNAPYSFNNPLNASPALSINPTTGLLTGTPTRIGQYVVGICATEYDANNNVLSVTLRDFQFNVAYCENRIFALLAADSVSPDSNRFFFRRCNQSTINFINQSRQLAAITDYRWEFSNGAVSTQTNPSIAFGGFGTYTGRLIVNPTSNTCIDTAQIFLTLYGNPVINFNLGIDSCNPTRPPITVTNNTTVPAPSTLAGLRYNWDFGNGGTSAIRNPTIAYNTPNTYTIRLTVTSNEGCSVTSSRTTGYFPPATAAYTISDNTGCVPHAVTFTNTSAPLGAGYTSIWNTGVGGNTTATNASATYTSPNTYNSRLTVTSPWGCVSTVTQPVTVFVPPVANFSFTYDSCVVDTVRFTDASTATNTVLAAWNWNFGDNATSTVRNARHLYGNANTYNINLVVRDANGCLDTATRQIRWYPAPIINVSNPDTGCTPFTVAFNNSSYPINGYTTAWSFGNGQTSNLASPTLTYNNAGTYFVNLLITSPIGCTANYRDTIVANARPSASFVLNYDSCQVAPIRFDETAQTNTAGTPLVSWSWNFGDNVSILARDTSHLYANVGTYNSSLIVVDANGCRDTARRQIRYYPATIMNIIGVNAPICQNQTVSFTNNSSPLDNTYTHVWNFGDGATSTITSPSHLYTQFGTFVVSLTTTSFIGCRSNFRDTVQVNELPNAAFVTNYDSCAFTGVRIRNTSSPNTAGANINNLSWNYGDGGTSINTTDTLYPYAPRDTYLIQLVVTDINGCRDTARQLLPYTPAPVFPVASHNQTGCAPQTVNFLNNPLNNYPGYTYLWNFGNGQIATSFDTAYTYYQGGLYFPTLTIRTPANCAATFRDTVRVFGLPIANASYSFDRCAITPVTFRNRSTPSPDAAITTLNWNLGDGTTANQPLIYHTYNLADTGLLDITLSVTDANGCQDDTTFVLDWRPKPIFPLTMDDLRLCQPAVVASPADNPYPVPYYTTVWNFGNGQVSNNGNPPVMTYPDTGVYTQTLIVVAPNGCTDTFAREIEVLTTPVADFNYSPNPVSSFNPTVQFTDASQNAFGWEWAFGVGRLNDYTFQQNPSYTYQDTGKFVVRLVAAHTNGCRDTAEKVIDIIPEFTYFLPNAFTPNSDGTNDGYRGNGIFTYIETFEMNIFNRWGELIYTAKNPTDAWNGRKQNTGELCPAGVYVVQVKLKAARGEQRELKGFATIIY